ncbi:barstar family protein [Mangrovitalea sediminis]|uniref:barstar family protein n=1 Tax=Mangrovitalea sediminis TaxID=1982043 RepID=UPI0011783E7E|nr:barstar family protein [Mangrovitalea sediminis]
MDNGVGVFSFSRQSIEKSIEEYRLQGWKIYYLPKLMVTKDQFFEGIRESLPLDPPLVTNRSWDALADSLWNGMDGLAEDKILIIWPDSMEMESKEPETFSIASAILADLTTLFADNEITNDSVKKIMVLRELS